MSLHRIWLFCLPINKAKSRKYQGVFEVKSRVKTWQVRGIWFCFEVPQVLCNNCFKLQNQTYLCISKFCRNSETRSSGQVKLHSHQTADQPPTNADQFLWLGRVWSGKKLPALYEERIYPRSTPAVSALYPWCTNAQIPLFTTYPRPSGWQIPALYDQPPTYSWYNYAHYAQYRTNPRCDFNSRPQMNVRA